MRTDLLYGLFPHTLKNIMRSGQSQEGQGLCCDSLISSGYSKHCQRHNGSQALGTLTHSTPIVRKWNLGQTSAWFCLAKGEYT